MKDYISLKSDSNAILIHESVFVSIVKEVINDEHDFLEKDVSVKQINNHIVLNVEVKVKKTNNITYKCSALQKRILEVIEQITDIELNEINIKIIGFIF